MEQKSREQFLRDYNFKSADLVRSGLEYPDLLQIKKDFESKLEEYDDAGAGVVRSLLRFGVVHALKYRIKEPEHLIAKVLRCRIKSPAQNITLNNYEEAVSDLIGIRILHLTKSHWYKVHEILQKHYNHLEPPVANIRAGDPDHLINIFKEKGCEVKVHPAGYRSVHYLIETAPAKKKFRVEVQVRTIFEEAWGEIDHAVRYPRLTTDPLMQEFLKILNRLAGSADEMAEFVLGLKEEILLKNTVSEQLKAEIVQLTTELDRSSLDSTEKEGIFKRLESLRALVLAQGERPILSSIYLPEKDELD